MTADDIKKSDFGRWFFILHRYGKVFFRQKLEPFSIRERQVAILMFLFHNKDGVSQDEIVNFFMGEKSSIAREIAGLEKKGFVTRQQDKKDKRVKRVYLTKQAINTMSKFDEARKEWIKIVTEGLSEEERHHFYNIMNHMISNAKNYLQMDFDKDGEL